MVRSRFSLTYRLRFAPSIRSSTPALRSVPQRGIGCCQKLSLEKRRLESTRFRRRTTNARRRTVELFSAALLIFFAGFANAQQGFVDDEFRAELGKPLQGPARPQGAQANKPRLLDRSDFYFHKSGRRISFLREEDTYVVIERRRSARAGLRSGRIEARLGNDAEVLDRRPFGRRPVFRVKKGRNRAAVLNRIRALDPETFVSPVLSSSKGKENVGVSPSVIVRLSSAANSTSTLGAIEASMNVSVKSSLRSSQREFELELLDSPDDVGEIFALARALDALAEVEWAEPNFVVSAEHFFTPSDPQYPNQWHLNNTGQGGAVVDADVDAPEGWDIADGAGMVIAVFDDGVDVGHEDLDIWANPGESGGGKETNGIDDDGNGYIDDHQGWDFGDHDNDPSPGSGDSHGTAVAGVAGAIGNNAVGVAGSALSAQILPIRSGSMSCTSWGDAMRYAGKYAHVVNNSWGIAGCESSIDSAISDVVSGSVSGAVRGALGTPVLFATGNSASGWMKYTASEFSGGTYDFEWRFDKDGSVDEGDDTVWLDDISWPGGASEDFEAETLGAVPSAFSSGGSANWTVVDDGIHARGATGQSAKAGAITHNQQTSLYALGKTVGAGSLTFWVWVSAEHSYDYFELYVDGAMLFQVAPGQYGSHENGVGYPASNADTIAVGASRDGSIGNEEQRAAYSQFGSALDVVAPSSGGGQGITTTDRTGTDGYASGNYTTNFGGTSSAAPLVAGIVVDILGNDPTLTAAQLRQTLKDGADQIGPYAYTSGRNDFYGDGRVNLLASMAGCGNGVVEVGETCDDGNTDPGDCCSATCQIETAGTVCRSSAGSCDVAEVCDGILDSCPTDVFEPITTVCRGAAGVCDAADTCDGATAICPADLKLTS
ncbi:MAG: S8 family serine peptidase, partial [bacterium]|nr:S8 family serine peptidase [bacterium]